MPHAQTDGRGVSAADARPPRGAPTGGMPVCDLWRHGRAALKLCIDPVYHPPGSTAGRPISMRALTAAEKQKLLEVRPLFGILGPEDVGALLSRARFESYAAGQVIFAKGSPGRSMMAVLDGSVRISSTAPSGREVVLAILSAGEIFGEMALLDGGERTADATAITDCELLAIDQREFIAFLERHSDVCIRFLKMLSQRLRRTDEQLETTLFERLESRIAKALIRLAIDGGATAGSGRSVYLRVSQNELGGIAGASRENVNKQLHVWQAAGLVELGKRLIVIHDLDRFEDLI